MTATPVPTGPRIRNRALARFLKNPAAVGATVFLSGASARGCVSQGGGILGA